MSTHASRQAAQQAQRASKPLERLPVPSSFSNFSSREISASGNRIAASEVLYPDAVSRLDLRNTNTAHISAAAAASPHSRASPRAEQRKGMWGELREEQLENRDASFEADEAAADEDGNRSVRSTRRSQQQQQQQPHQPKKKVTQSSQRLFRTAREMQEMIQQTGEELERDRAKHREVVTELEEYSERLSRQQAQLDLLNSKIGVASVLIKDLVEEHSKTQAATGGSRPLPASAMLDRDLQALSVEAVTGPIMEYFTGGVDIDAYTQERLQDMTNIMNDLVADDLDAAAMPGN